MTPDASASLRLDGLTTMTDSPTTPTGKRLWGLERDEAGTVEVLRDVLAIEREAAQDATDSMLEVVLARTVQRDLAKADADRLAEPLRRWLAWYDMGMAPAKSIDGRDGETAAKSRDALAQHDEAQR